MLASDWFEFSSRYQLPALVKLPPAGALGIAALLRRSPAARSWPGRKYDPQVLAGLPGLA